MYDVLKRLIFAILFLACFVTSAMAYEIPQRRIDFKPYLNFMIPNSLMENENSGTAVEDDMGIGIGLKARTQITGFWGFAINTSMTDLKVNDNSLSTAMIFTVGFYYSQATNLGNIIFDMGYGVISVADLSSTLLMPTLEFNRVISDRLSIAAEFGMPIANDWFYDFDVKENFKSIMLSLGSTILF
jgi:hypothetical protein